MDYLVTFASLAQQYSDNPLAKFAVDEVFDIQDNRELMQKYGIK